MSLPVDRPNADRLERRPLVPIEHYINIGKLKNCKNCENCTRDFLIFRNIDEPLKSEVSHI